VRGRDRAPLVVRAPSNEKILSRTLQTSRVRYSMLMMKSPCSRTPSLMGLPQSILCMAIPNRASRSLYTFLTPLWSINRDCLKHPHSKRWSLKANHRQATCLNQLTKFILCPKDKTYFNNHKEINCTTNHLSNKLKVVNSTNWPPTLCSTMLSLASPTTTPIWTHRRQCMPLYQTIWTMTS